MTTTPDGKRVAVPIAPRGTEDPEFVRPRRALQADAVRGRTPTSFPSLRTDVRNAGGTWVDEEVVVDDGLVTSRNPNDPDAFRAKLVEAVGGRRPERTGNA